MKERIVTRGQVPAHEMTIVSWSVTCDRCGAKFAREDFATGEIIIALDPNECVGAAHRRDYCTECFPAIWPALCAVIGVDPDDYSRTGWDDE